MGKNRLMEIFLPCQSKWDTMKKSSPTSGVKTPCCSNTNRYSSLTYSRDVRPAVIWLWIDCVSLSPLQDPEWDLNPAPSPTLSNGMTHHSAFCSMFCGATKRLQSLPADPTLTGGHFVFSGCVSSFSIFALHGAPLCAHCDIVVLECSLEHNTVLLETAGSLVHYLVFDSFSDRLCSWW